MTIAEMIERYNITLMEDGEHLKISSKPNAQEVESIRENKQAIIDHIKAERAAKKERERKIAAIPGLQKIKDNISDWKRWRCAFDEMMESGDSMMDVARPRIKTAELKKQYPIAAAYLKAESWASSNNSAKWAAGNKALERIINGEDHEVVISEMEEEWGNYCMEYVD